MKYDVDSYLLYCTSDYMRYSFSVRIILKEAVDVDILKSACKKVEPRFPYFTRQVRIDKESGYVLEHNTRPIVVRQSEDKTVYLGSEDVNGHLVCIEYDASEICFHVNHSITALAGAMPWVKSLLHQYITEKYQVEIDIADIKLPNTIITQAETAYPDIAQIPKDNPFTLRGQGESYEPRAEIIKAAQMSYREGVTCFRFLLEQESFMKYSKSKGGSPNSILAAFMFKAMCRSIKPSESEHFLCAIACNYRKDVGCPETYHDFTRMLRVCLPRKLEDWSINQISIAVRGAMYLQMEPEFSYQVFRNWIQTIEGIDQQNNMNDKKTYATAHSTYKSSVIPSFNISYVGQVQWGGLATYIEGVYSNTLGHPMLEVCSLGSKICVAFNELFSDNKYLESFCSVMKEEGVPYQLEGPFRVHIPSLKIGE